MVRDRNDFYLGFQHSVNNVERIVQEHKPASTETSRREALRRFADPLYRMFDLAHESGRRRFAASEVPGCCRQKFVVCERMKPNALHSSEHAAWREPLPKGWF